MNNKKATRDYRAIKEDYLQQGINDDKLRNTTDIYNIHSIDYTSTKGFNDLDDPNKKLYEKFIINFYNSFSSLFVRDVSAPIGIYPVEGIKDKSGKAGHGLLFEWKMGNSYESCCYIEDENKYFIKETFYA
jgi:hypothetical protein